MNRAAITSVLAIASLALAGEDLSAYKNESGDLCLFVANKINFFGFDKKITPLKKNLPAKWKYKQDENGIIIYFIESEFENVMTLLEQNLGKPDRYFEKNNPPMGWYSVKNHSIGILFIKEKELSQITIIRKLETSNNPTGQPATGPVSATKSDMNSEDASRR